MLKKFFAAHKKLREKRKGLLEKRDELIRAGAKKFGINIAEGAEDIRRGGRRAVKSALKRYLEKTRKHKRLGK